MDWTTITGIVLALCAIGSALAFGGVETLAFAPAEFAVVLLAVVQFWRKGWPAVSRLTLWVLGIVVAIPLLQLLPLSAHVLSTISPARVALARDLFSSIAPLEGGIALSVNSYETQLAILKLLCYLLVFLLAFQTYQLRSEQSALILMLLLLGLFEAVYGTVQYLTGRQDIFADAGKVYTYSRTGTYVNRNHFAGLLEMVLPFAMARMLVRVSSHEGEHRSRWKQMMASLLSVHLLRDIIVFAMIAVGLVFSRSRTGIVAAIVGMMLVAGIVFLQTRRRSVLVIGLLILALPLCYSFWVGLNPVVERFEALTLPGGLEQERLGVWSHTMNLIRDYPLLGTGLGTYRWANAHYQVYLLWGIFEHAHNDYLEFAADIGIPATVLLFGSFWVLAVKVARRAFLFERAKDRVLAAGCAGAMVAMLIHEITDFNLQMPANAFIFAWIVGTAAALCRAPVASAASSGPLPRSGP